MARRPNELRHTTLTTLLDRLEALEPTEKNAGEELKRAYRREISRVRDLLSTYTGRPNPAREMFARDLV